MTGSEGSVKDLTQLPTDFNDETCSNHSNFGLTDSSGDEYAGVGACSVFSETESDFDGDNHVDDCVTWDSDSEVTGECGNVGTPADIDRAYAVRSDIGGGTTRGIRPRVSFHPYCSYKDSGASAFRCMEYSQESVEWDEVEWIDPVPECMPKRLVRKRVSEGLTAEQVARRLDVPLGTRPKLIKEDFFKREDYLRKSLMATITATLRAEGLTGKGSRTEKGGVTHTALWDKCGDVLLFKRVEDGDGCGWMTSDQKYETLTFKRMLSSLKRPEYGHVRHYLAPGCKDRKEYSNSIATVMQLDRKVNHIPEIVLRWLVDSGASQHILPQKYMSSNREMFEGHVKPFTHGLAFETANGQVIPEGAVTAWVRQLREKSRVCCDEE